MKSEHETKTTTACMPPPGISSIHSQQQFELILNWYKPSGKRLAGEEQLNHMPLPGLMDALGHPIWNQLYHCWAIQAGQMKALQPYIEHIFQPESFVYFIEATNIN